MDTHDLRLRVAPRLCRICRARWLLLVSDRYCYLSSLMVDIGVCSDTKPVFIFRWHSKATGNATDALIHMPMIHDGKKKPRIAGLVWLSSI